MDGVLKNHNTNELHQHPYGTQRPIPRIVPARNVDKSTDKLYLPFEGGRGLSLIISKAVLLAEDHKITDSPILSQIKR